MDMSYDSLLERHDSVERQGNEHQHSRANGSPSKAVTSSHPTQQQYEPSALRQLFATIKRQLIQKMRMPFSLLIEVLLPVVFVAALIAGNSAAGTSVNPGNNFVYPSDNATGVVPIAEPTVLIKERFCYNGSRLSITEAREAVYGGDCLDRSSLKCNAGAGDANCGGAQQLSCTDQFARFGIPGGFCFYNDALEYVKQFLMGRRSSKILDLGAMVLTQWVALILNNGPVMEFFENEAILMSGPLGFSPDTPETARLIELLNETIPMFRFVAGKTYPSRAAAMNFFTSIAGEGQWGLVDLEQMSSEGLVMSLALNRTAVPGTTTTLARFAGGLASTRFIDLMNSGFMTIQNEISRIYVTRVLNISADLVDSLVVAPMGYQPYRSSAFLQIAGSSLAPLTLVLSFLYTVSQLAKRLVEEKELRLREGAMVMGLGKFAFYASWIITYLIQIFFSSILLTVVIKAGLIEQSDPVLIFVLYFLFALSTVLLSVLLSSFFSKSRITALVVPLIYFGLSIPSFSLPETTSASTYVALSLFSPTAFGIGTRLLFSYEVNDGMGWNDLSNADDVVNMGGVIGLLIFDCVLYLLLTLYFDEVLPSEWGSKSHPCFCFCLCCRKKDAVMGTVVNSASPIPSKGRTSEFMESYPTQKATSSPVASHARAFMDSSDGSTVHIQSLRKEFTLDTGTKVAVDDLDLKIYPDQITVLLGHNGAGKTTTMNMITGMLPITSGDCIVYGKSSKFELKAVRSEIGFCPQHNILWGQLTCAEHLRYFATLKGVPSDKVEGQVDEMLTKVDLMDKKDFFSDQLSGGQKRKLSVAIAFIGGSRLILLDEPTAGMDVAARRHTWDLLKEMSAGRTIILTTHFMDEADLLGNRIAIMSKGSLHSYGSSTFLKARLGTGYALRVSVQPPAADESADIVAARAQSASANVLKKVQTWIPDATVKEAKGQEIAFSLPMKDAALFGDVVAGLEDGRFMATHKLSGLSMSVSTLEDVFVRIAEDDHGPDGAVGANNHLDQAQHQEETVKLLDEMYHRMEQSPCTISFSRQFSGLMWKRFHNMRRDRRTIVLQIIVPSLCILLAMALAQFGPPDTKLLWLDGSMYTSTNQQIPITGLSCDKIGANLDARYADPSYRWMPNDGNQSFLFSQQLVDEFKSHGDEQRMIAFSCGDVGYNTSIWYGAGSQLNTGVATVALFNASSIYSLAQAVAAYYNGLAGTYGTAPGATKNATVRVASYPMPFTARQSATIDGLQNLLVGIFIMIPFTFIPSTYVSWIVKERQCKAKHLQTVSGMNFIAYWTSNFVFDIASFFLTELLALILFAAFKRTEYVGADAIGGTILLFVLYGVSGIVWAYFFSFLFDNHGTAQNLTMLANFLAGFALVITMYILRELPSTSEIADIIVFFCRLIPAYCLGDGIMVLANIILAEQTGGSTNVWDMDQLGWDFVFMGLEVVIFGAATLLWDHPQRQLKKQQLLFDRNAEAPALEQEDEDVRRERSEVEAASPSSARRTDVVKVQKLRKVYENGKVAVQNVTFGVKAGEVFGFLGTNGAGKTTTMSILTSEFLPTMGHCSIGGFDVVEQASEAQRMLGFCPQFDALHDLMTCEEHLYLYAALRGVPVAETQFVVDTLLKACDIEQFRSVPSKKLSGGNKRKLSVAIALIGAPRLVLLDEPSAGMDPLARRLMWDVINFVARKSSVVLTTHHLEEVDVLAHRVGIMVDGTLRCLGSLDHLKRKFGSGYEVTIKVADATSDQDPVRNSQEIEEFMRKQFPSAELIESRNDRMTFSISSKTTLLSRVFKVLQTAKDARSCAIAEYTVQQSSLEQVFLRISEGEAVSMDGDVSSASVTHRPSLPLLEGYESPVVPAPSSTGRRSAAVTREEHASHSELLNLL